MKCKVTMANQIAMDMTAQNTKRGVREKIRSKTKLATCSETRQISTENVFI